MPAMPDAQVYSEQSEVLRQGGQVDAAQRCAERCLEVAKQGGEIEQEAAAQLLKGQVLREAGKYLDAVAAYKEHLQVGLVAKAKDPV